MKKDVEIVLKKEGATDIIVKCPETIKLHPVAAWFAISNGLPPASINPKQGKDILKAFVLFFCIFASLLFCYLSIALGIVACLVVIGINVGFNRNYFFNFIRNKLEEGYIVENEEQKKLLETAGVYDKPSESTGKSKLTVFNKINAFINRLPFNGIAAKLPIIQRFSKYANYAVCVLVILLVLGLCTSKSPIDSYLDDFEHIIKSYEVALDKCENGSISYEEFLLKVNDIVDDVGNLDGDNLDNMNSKQKKRYTKCLNKLEKLSERSERVKMQYYY